MALTTLRRSRRTFRTKRTKRFTKPRTKPLARKTRTYTYKKRWSRKPRVAKSVGIRSDLAENGNDLAVHKFRTGRNLNLYNIKTMSRLLQASYDTNVVRVQGLKQQDVGRGYYTCAQRANAGGSISLPVHVWDLTRYPNTALQSDVGYVPYWTGTGGTAVLGKVYLPSQAPDGSDFGSATLVSENKSVDSFPDVTKLCHMWSQIKLKLYGARNRGTTWYIEFVRVPNEFAQLDAAAPSNAQYEDLMRYLERPLIYNSLQSFYPRVAKDIKYVKRFKFYVPGASSGDIDSVGKTRDVNIFMRQGNVYNFDWQVGALEAGIPHNLSDGADYIQDNQKHNNPYFGSRLYMIVRASCPSRIIVSDLRDQADINTEGSYDMIIRNKWMIPA